MKEIWKSIPCYEGIYEASNLGRVRTSKEKTTYTKRHGVRHWKQRILKIKFCTCTRNKNRKDGRVELWKNGKHKTFLVARLIASSFLENNLFNNRLTVNHIDGNSLNNNIDNLEWCSRAENIKKGFEMGLYKTCKKIKIIDKKTKQELYFNSLSKGSSFLGKNPQYLSCKINNQKFENDSYIWKLL